MSSPQKDENKCATPNSRFPWQEEGSNSTGLGLSLAFSGKHSTDRHILEEARRELNQLQADVPLNLEEARNEQEADNSGPPTATLPSEENVDMQPNDPGSPSDSVKSFEDLTLLDKLRMGLCDMGFSKPSKIQEMVWAGILGDLPTNMIAQSPLGTGKTAAFVLAMLNKVDVTRNSTQAICLSPTCELALQTGQVAEKMGKFCPEVKIGYAVSGEEVSRGQEVTDHILFGTPGTMLDWIVRHCVIDLKKVKMFVSDAADVMTALQRLQLTTMCEALPDYCQRLLFFTNCDEEEMKYAKTIVPDPVIIRLGREEESLDNIKQYYAKLYAKCCGKKAKKKFQALSDMYGVEHIGQCIVFCNTPKAASWLAQRMKKQNHTVALLSGEMTGEQRSAVLNGFRERNERLLITTVPLYGIDVQAVTHVVNYDMPVDPTGKPDFKSYQHRIGQTGRFGKKGVAVNFIDSEESMAAMREIEQHFGKEVLSWEKYVDASWKLA